MAIVEKLKEYRPLIIIISIIVFLTLLLQIKNGYNLDAMMYDMMGITFVVFGGIKLLRWGGFVEAFQMYDDVARRFYWWAVAYPFFEIGLGLLYWFRIMPVATNIITILLTSLTTFSVVKELRKNNPFPCACLGAVFVLPMTWVTLVENMFVIGMALIMLARMYF